MTTINKNVTEEQPNGQASSVLGELDLQDRPNGPVAAVLLAGGIGCAVLGIIVTFSENIPALLDALNWYPPVGALIGKTTIAVIAFFVSWLGLHIAFQGKEVDFKRYATLAFIGLAIGLVGTFPPFFDLFSKH